MLITAKKLTVIFSILAVTTGCGFFSRVTGGDEIVLEPTEVGSPVGEKLSKEIGPAGGTVESADGRLTLTVPPNAVTENVEFSIQAISNHIQDGIGTGYRLEPGVRSFNAAVILSARYSEQDVEGTYPQAIRLAYQDEKGAWHQQNSTTLDTTNKRVSVSTTHLSDWIIHLGDYMKIIPSKADVFVGKTVPIVIRRCDIIMSWRLWLGRKICEDGVWGSIAPGVQTFALHGPGQLDLVYPKLVYTAPARKPIPNVATVVYRPDFKDKETPDLETKITIHDHAYRATGQSGSMTFSGVVCSLEKPFTIYGHSQLTFNFNFTPSSDPSAGTVGLSGGGMGVTLHNGNGTYTVSGIDTDRPRIALTMESFKGSFPGVGTAEGSGTRYIDLVPLDTDECGEPAPPPRPPRRQPPQLRGKGPF